MKNALKIIFTRAKRAIRDYAKLLFSKSVKNRFLENHEVLLADLLNESRYKRNEDLRVALQQTAEAFELFNSRTTVLQVLLLSHSTNKLILVANTHLHFRPEDPHIRLLQAALSVRYMESVLETLKPKYPKQQVGVIFCGDFNSGPNTGVVELLTHGTIGSTHHEWSAGNSESVRFLGLDLESKLKFVNGTGRNSYTNYTKQKEGVGFVGCLDYIWVDSNIFSVERIIPTPSHELVTKYIAIPSRICPSDHLPVICDISYQ